MSERIAKIKSRWENVKKFCKKELVARKSGVTIWVLDKLIKEERATEENIKKIEDGLSLIEQFIG